MESSVRQTTGAGGSGEFLSFVKPDFRSKWKSTLLPWQEKGILSKHLWTKKNSVVRIIPGYDPATGEVYPQNIRVNEYATDAQHLTDYLSDTFFLAKTVQGFGKNAMRFITDYPPGSPDEQRFAGNTAINIFGRTVWYTVDAIKKGKKAHCTPTPEWEAWVGKKPTLAFDRITLLFQALVFVCNDKYFENEAGQAYILADGTPAPFLAVVGIDHAISMMELERALVEPMDPGKNLNAATNNKHGAFAEMNGNLLYFNSYIPPEAKHPALKPSVQEPGPGWTPQPYPLSADQVKMLWTPWKDLLHYMTASEQILLLAKEFGADTVNYVLGLHPTFAGFEFPEAVRAAGLGRYAAFVDPGLVPEQFRGGNASPYVNEQPATVMRPAAGGLAGLQVAPQPVAQAVSAVPQAQPVQAGVQAPRPLGLGGAVYQAPATAAARPAPAAVHPQPVPQAAPQAAGLRTPAARPAAAVVSPTAPVDRAKLAAEVARVRAGAVAGGLPSVTPQVPQETVELAQQLLQGEGGEDIPEVSDEIPF